MDSLLAERGLRQPFFRLVSAARPVGGTTRSVVAGSRTINDLADVEAIRAEYTAGATIVLQSLHRIWPPVARFCRDLAAELGHPTQCNAYVTPAGNAQGFAFHHDTHDVFVLQIAGRKRWIVHQPALPLPTPRQPRSGDRLVPSGQQPLVDTVLGPGDSLYLPRGFVHAAQTTDQPSIHLTVGVAVTTWADLLADAVATLAIDDVGWRRALPVAAGGSLDEHAVASELRKLGAEWFASLPDDAIGRLLADHAAKVAPPEPLGVMSSAASAAELRTTSRVRPRRGLRWRTEDMADRVALILPRKRIELPGVAREMLRRVLACPTTPEELAEADPLCDVDDALVVVRRLLREGVLAPDS